MQIVAALILSLQIQIYKKKNKLIKVQLEIEWGSINQCKGCEECNGGKHA